MVISHCIPMADYVAETGCGQVVRRLETADLLSAIGALAEHYEIFQANARRVGVKDFSREAMLGAYDALYRALAAQPEH